MITSEFGLHTRYMYILVDNIFFELEFGYHKKCVVCYMFMCTAVESCFK